MIKNLSFHKKILLREKKDMKIEKKDNSSYSYINISATSIELHYKAEKYKDIGVYFYCCVREYIMYILNTFNLTSFKCILQVFERITIKSILLVLHKNSNFYC